MRGAQVLRGVPSSTSLSPNRIATFLSFRGLGTPEISCVSPPSESAVTEVEHVGVTSQPPASVCAVVPAEDPGPPLCARVSDSGSPQPAVVSARFPGEAAGTMCLWPPDGPSGWLPVLSPGPRQQQPPRAALQVSGQSCASCCPLWPAPQSMAIPPGGPAWLWALRPGSFTPRFCQKLTSCVLLLCVHA